MEAVFDDGTSCLFPTNVPGWFLSAGIEIAKSRGAKYRLGPELEIRWDERTLTVSSGTVTQEHTWTDELLVPLDLFFTLDLHRFPQWLRLCGPLP